MSKLLKDLKQELYELRYKLAGATETIDALSTKLAEKETDLSLARNEINTLKHNLKVAQEHDNVMCKQYFEKCKKINQDKILFCIEQLNQTKGKIQHNILFVNCDDYVNVIEQIDNQIEELKKEMK